MLFFNYNFNGLPPGRRKTMLSIGHWQCWLTIEALHTMEKL